jgi:hypothetical protein
MLLLWCLTANAADEHLELSAGVGLPELVHAEAAVSTHRGTAFGVRVASTVLNPELGIELSTLVAPGAPGLPRHSLLLDVQAMINPTAPVSLQSGGDRLSAYVAPGIGYAYHATNGILVRALVAVLVYDDGGLAVGPNASVSVGYWFPIDGTR